MKTITLLQSQKPHNPNALHDAFIAAGLTPIAVESTEDESRFFFADAVSNTAIQAVITAYTFTPPTTNPDLKALAQAFRSAVTAATTVGQLKSALNQELMLLIREVARRDVKDL